MKASMKQVFQHRSFRQLLPALLLPLASFAQLDRGTLTGLVSDTTGAAVPGVRIEVRNVANNAVYKAESTSVGQFNVPNLPVGEYELTVTAEGFKKFVRGGIMIRAAEVIRVDATLQVGSMVETIQVTAEAPRLQTDSPQVGTSLANRNIIDLPLSFSAGRSPEAFAYLLTPAVIGTPWVGHINGSTTASKEVLLDGASVTTNRAGHFGEASVSIEAVQEFKVQTSGMSAEFGRMQAGVFNFIMKSGTNNVRGSAFGALRNEALNANTFANNARGKNGRKIASRISGAVLAVLCSSPSCTTAGTRRSSMSLTSGTESVHMVSQRRTPPCLFPSFTREILAACSVPYCRKQTLLADRFSVGRSMIRRPCGESTAAGSASSFRATSFPRAASAKSQSG